MFIKPIYGIHSIYMFTEYIQFICCKAHVVYCKPFHTVINRNIFSILDMLNLFCKQVQNKFSKFKFWEITRRNNRLKLGSVESRLKGVLS